jgi:hypothetical protein
MPREQINYPPLLEQTNDNPAVPPGHKDGDVWRDSALHVGWHADVDGGGHVQVALESDLSYLRMALDSPNETEGRTSMYTPVLNRAELNKLIRTLKRARDAAYGRDE